jgi:hypothetical protein
MDLRRHWADTERQLREARAALSVVRAQDPSLGTDPQFQEFLDANELQLALEELEGLGGQTDAPPAFWSILRAAAERMELHDHAARYAERAADSAR